METFFRNLSNKILGTLKPNEDLMINFWGENSLFTRFNQSKARQIKAKQGKGSPKTTKSGVPKSAFFSAERRVAEMAGRAGSGRDDSTVCAHAEQRALRATTLKQSIKHKTRKQII